MTMEERLEKLERETRQLKRRNRWLMAVIILVVGGLVTPLLFETTASPAEAKASSPDNIKQRTDPSSIGLSFDILFPVAKQDSMGLVKLTQAEKEELRKHVISLLLATAEIGAKLPTQSEIPRDPMGGTGQQGSIVESSIDGESTGWDGSTIIKLMNGQIWEQTEFYFRWHWAFMPHVTIFYTNGMWKMLIAGIDKAVGVRRIK